MQHLHTVDPKPRNDDYRFCIDCRYPLKGLEWIGDCPECGRPYDLGNDATYALEERGRWQYWGVVGYILAWPLLIGLVLVTRWLVAHASFVLVFFPFPLLAGILFCMIQLRIHRVTDRTGSMMVTGAALGALSLYGIDGAPIAPVAGTVVGVMAGLGLNMLQSAGWVE